MIENEVDEHIISDAAARGLNEEINNIECNKLYWFVR